MTSDKKALRLGDMTLGEITIRTSEEHRQDEIG